MMEAVNREVGLEDEFWVETDVGFSEKEKVSEGDKYE